jgi:hypothetical protein
MAITDGFNIKSSLLVFNTQKTLSREHIKDIKGLFNMRETEFIILYLLMIFREILIKENIKLFIILFLNLNIIFEFKDM